MHSRALTVGGDLEMDLFIEHMIDIIDGIHCYVLLGIWYFLKLISSFCNMQLVTNPYSLFKISCEASENLHAAYDK